MDYLRKMNATAKVLVVGERSTSYTRGSKVRREERNV